MDARTQAAEGAAQPTILIVDDTPPNIQFLAEILQPDYRIRVANSGRRALQILAKDPRPDLILLDVMMPELDGYAVLEKLRDDPATRDIPVIFVTAMDTTEYEQRGLDLGAVDYITKPLRPPIVRARVQAQLELKHARDWLKNENEFLDAEVQRRIAEVQRRVSEIQLIQDVAIHALARLAETRDPETGKHLRRTKRYVRALARKLQEHPRYADVLTDQYVELVAKSAPLHDIGKVGIRDEILLKPGSLTSEEWEIMKTHAKRGSDAIEQAEADAEKPVEFLTVAKEIARWHHERWDGSGYPDGLAGEAIPISARLMALADTFDAVTSRRVYQEPVAFARARDIIVAERGHHFDPDIVDAFLAIFDDFVAIAKQHGDGGESALVPATESSGAITA